MEAGDKRGCTMKQASALTELPSELKQRVASFLSVRDLMKLTKTSKSIRSNLDVTLVSSPLTDRASQNKVYQTLDTQQCFATVVPNQESLPHSMTFCCGVISAGRSGGIVCIKEQEIPVNSSPNDLKETSFAVGKVVATIADLYDGQRIVLSFYPQRNKYYQFWIRSDGFDDDEALPFESMRLCCIGFGANPMDYTAYQYDDNVQRRRRYFRTVVK
ncbi:unnamed protein product [Cylindrotheca closterium]|uniref:F-box domain-containing protein n=1 Tax=Cylindrotheca closterium TaxID=2856 RepID=A0AAD2JIY8_9STRA|nr:unnamed protein product [Cylindrotheca closterium]